jgi:hypothetical protein
MWCCATHVTDMLSLTRRTHGFKPDPHRQASQNAPGRIRTCGLALRRRALYPLSYGRGERPVYPRRRVA